jgi:hypothetical protein
MLSPGATLVGLVMKYRDPTMRNISAQQNTPLAVSRCPLLVAELNLFFMTALMWRRTKCT